MAVVPSDSFFDINIYDLWKKEMLVIAENFQFKSSDIVIMGLPRAGTTVIAELVWLLVNNLDYEGAQKFIGSRVPTLENYINFHILKMKNPYYQCADEVIEIDNLPEPRIFITHIPLQYLPKLQVSNESSPKIIFVDRDVREVFVSLYHYVTAVSKMYKGTLDNFLDLYTTIDPYSPWIGQIQQLRELSVNRKVLYMPYTDISERFCKVIINIIQFLEKEPLLIPAFIKLEKHFVPYCYKQNVAVNHFNQYGVHGFIRKCKSGKSLEELPKKVWNRLNIHAEKLMPNPYNYVMEEVD